jgi:site-specific DNA recombinase
MWMGGTVPFGYDVKNKKLVINPDDAKTVQLIYQRDLELGSVRALKGELDRLGMLSRSRPGGIRAFSSVNPDSSM